MDLRPYNNYSLSELQRRSKWTTEKDFVLIKEDLLPATEWRLGRVKNVIYCTDQRVRIAEVLTSNGLIKRPILKLCKLPIESNIPSKPITQLAILSTTRSYRFKSDHILFVLYKFPCSLFTDHA